MKPQTTGVDKIFEELRECIKSKDCTRQKLLDLVDRLDNCWGADEIAKAVKNAKR